MKHLFITLLLCCFLVVHNVNAEGGVKYVIQLRLFHYETEDEPEKITHEIGTMEYDSVGLCAKARLSPEFELGLQAHFHGKGIKMIQTRCLRLLPDKFGA